MFYNVASPIVKITLAIVCAFAGVYYINDAAAFDFVIVVAFVLAGIVLRRNHDLLFVMVILVLGRLVEDAIFYFAEGTLIWKVVIYSLSAAAVNKFKADKLRYVFGVVLIAAVAAEFSWYLNDEPAPGIYWSVALALVSFVLRTVFIVRPFILTTYFKTQGNIIQPDWDIRVLLSIPLLVSSANVIEYLIRNLTETNPLWVFYATPYLMHGTNVIAMWIILDYSFQTRLQRSLKA